MQTSEIIKEGANSVSCTGPEVFYQDTEDLSKINNSRNIKERYQQRTAAAEISPLRNADRKIISSVYCIRKTVTAYDKLVFLIFSHMLIEKNSTSKELLMATISNEESMKASPKSFLIPYRI